jgi:glucosyl-3-phosphoglycerate phosphatase
VTSSAPAALPASRLLVWRHGRTEWNAEGRFQGQLDPPLDDEGRRQAARIAPYLAAGLPAEETVVVSSDLGRAVETAAALTAVLGVPLRQDPRLREHGLGCWEGLTRNEVADRYPEQYADWTAGRVVRGRGGEEAAHVAERALAALADLPETAVAVVVTHGGTAGRLIEALLGLGPEHRRVFGPLANCAWSEVAFEHPRWRVLRHNVSVPTLPEGTGARSEAPGRAAAGRPRAGATPEEAAAAPLSDADAAL